MKPVTATYRLQLREGFGFDDAAAAAPYIAGLGASHVYLSPIWRAAPGSTHGYDVCDHNEIEPEIGGRAGFDHFAESCRRAGLGVVLDIVPNHMAASPANPWWADMLAWGRASRWSEHFDVDWSAEKLLLPILGAPYVEALEQGAFKAVRVEGGLSLDVYGAAYPLTPPSWSLILAAGGPELADAALPLAAATSDAHERVGEIVSALDPAAIDAALDAFNADREALHRLHEAQPWRLAHWRMAREALTYRRFFEVTELVGVKVERSDVFDDVHDLTLTLIEEGLVDGLRVDHVDGLADPGGYLARLREAVGPETPVWVEKILHRGEALKPDWPVEGTTGYEFIADMAALMTDPGGEAALGAAFVDAAPQEPGYAEMVDAAKRFILTHNLAAELEALTTTAVGVARRQLATRDLGRDTLRRSIIEIARQLPRYRTYVSARGVDAEDRALIAAVAEAARATREVENEIGVDFIAALLALDFDDPEDQAEALAFAARFQQVTGPVTAKAVEDTAFYRYNRLIGLNEVGGAPDRFGAPPEEIHTALGARAEAAPAQLNAATTHDTKRGEDARARLYALSLAPERWTDLSRRLALELAAFREVEDGDASAEWLFLQTLLGVWPEEGPPEGPALSDLAERVQGALLKAAREAKALTSWTQIDAVYEGRLQAFVARALGAEGAAFRTAFAEGAAPFLAAGRVIGLAQQAFRLLAPGAPDLYRGAEAGDFSMVDPDNRRPVDFRVLASPGGAHARAKSDLTRALLALRRAYPQIAAEGAYAPLQVDDPESVFGFLRLLDGVGFGVAAPIRSGAARLAGLRGAATALTARVSAEAGAAALLDGRPVGDLGAGVVIELGAGPAIFTIGVR